MENESKKMNSEEGLLDKLYTLRLYVVIVGGLSAVIGFVGVFISSHWVEAVGACLAIAVVLVIVSYVAEVSHFLVEVAKEEPKKLEDIAAAIKKTYDHVRQRTVVETIDTHRPGVFEHVFGGASKIRAYNPPLTLLIRRDNRDYRNVIYKVLRDGGTYQMIVGKTGDAGKTAADRVVQLYELWKNEQEGDVESILKRMRVSSYLCSQGLHTWLRSWPVFYDDSHPGHDLRGLSFFLIEGKETRKVLLYILGDPFLKDFDDVPKMSLMITEPVENPEIYHQLAATFMDRWGALEDRGTVSQVLHDLELSKFCAEYKRIDPGAGSASHSPAGQPIAN